jgi:hypothetical protein
MCWPTSPTTWSFHSIFFVMVIFVTRTPYHEIPCDLDWWVACCEDFVVKSGVYARCGQLDMCAGIG